MANQTPLHLNINVPNIPDDLNASMCNGMFLRKAHEKIQISRSCTRVHFELCAGDNQSSNLKTLMFQRLLKLHFPLLL